MKKLSMRKFHPLMILWILSSFLIGCSSTPVVPIEKPSVRVSVESLVHTKVSPISLPEKFKHTVQKYVDGSGKTWVLVDPSDLDRVKSAYTSAEGNALLVNDMNEYNKLIIDRANLVRDLAILEEYRSARLELRIEEERINAKAQRDQDALDTWLWRAAAFLSLAVGL